MRPKILTVGRFEVNIEMTLPYLPSAGHTVRGRDIFRFPGGSGLNSAVALNRICADAVPSGRVGEDASGRRLLSFLAEQNVDTRYITKDPFLPTGNFVRITEENDSSLPKFHGALFEGAGAKFSPEDVEFGYKSYPMGTIVSADIPDETLLAAVFLGAKEGVPVLLDAAGRKDPPLPVKELRSLEIFLTDGETATRMTGVEPTSLEKSLKCCIALSGMLKARYYILKLAERGNFIYDGTYHRVVPAYEGEGVGCAAAHQYFVAALFAKYIVSGDIKAATELGAVAEAAARRRSGSAAALPTAPELKRFIQENTENN